MLQDLRQLFVLCTASQMIGGDFAKFCGLLRIYELYTGLIGSKSFCLQRVYFFENFEIDATNTDKNTFLISYTYKVEIGQHFLKSERNPLKQILKNVKTKQKSLSIL